MTKLHLTVVFTLIFTKFTILQAYADSTGIYVGTVRKVSEVNKNFGELSDSYKVKYTIYDYGTEIEAIIPFADHDEPNPEVLSINGVATFDYVEYYTHRRVYDCTSHVTVQIEDVKKKSALLTYSFRDDCTDGATVTATYQGRVKRFSEREDINFLGEGTGLTEKTECFKLDKPTTFDWDFWDTGGFLALFKVTVRSCGSNRPQKMVDISRDAEELYRTGSFKIKSSGRYRFEVRSTGQWEIDKRF